MLGERPIILEVVSVVVRTKNRPAFLQRALTSIADQTFSRWHIYLINDGGDEESTDTSIASLLPRIGDRITVVHHESSVGMEAASNKGLSLAKGEFIAIHDDDDSWDPRFLENCIATMESNPDRAGVISHWKTVYEDESGTRLPDWVDFEQRPPSHLLGLYYFATPMRNFPPIAFLYRRNILQSIGPYREDLPVLGDWEFLLRFLRVGDLALVPQVLANYHLRPLSQNSLLGNTVVALSELHAQTQVKLRGEWMREDLANGRFGLGMIVSMAGIEHHLHHEMVKSTKLEIDASRIQTRVVHPHFVKRALLILVSAIPRSMRHALRRRLQRTRLWSLLSAHLSLQRL